MTDAVSGNHHGPERIRELAERATPGPWVPIDSPNEGQASAVTDANLDVILYVGVKNRPNANNARYLAACDPQTVLQLLDEIEELKHQRDDYKQGCGHNHPTGQFWPGSCEACS